jgi:phosphatidate cytidylyltransferase
VLLLIAPVLLRHDQSYGMAALLILFAIVWTTDIAGYFAGRAIGGPKLAPALSPKKTWSGAIASLIGAAIVIAVSAPYITGTQIVPLVVLAVVLSIASQAGDLAESALKRRFNVKDASQIIPGHGGVMDRLDGFWAAVVCAAIIGLARGGFSEPARGLLVW